MLTGTAAATSSYVSVQPPAFHSLTAPGFGVAPAAGASRVLYSAGGPTGESHTLRADGSIGERIEEIVFLKGGPSALRVADKTRKALVSAAAPASLHLLLMPSCGASATARTASTRASTGTHTWQTCEQHVSL
jgi:hypothetical protein